ncbi:hypothetical protein [Lentimicrobium sp.]|jgi:hypothetical protein|uniref:hypothetical protein n=2 Tax=Lentimicrobium sp. TaxID=2034841 RepID=UPI002CAD1B16|nr:hypothetical protein [Lentimicrobium sp.]HOP14754.1 hypothetical protein [Lentimicrobium sp.]HPJ62622.1 hypothetical protein [Lentimicrobium sp.]HPR24777.1 hypothetical protein [Lentimicrobium sp.]
MTITWFISLLLIYMILSFVISAMAVRKKIGRLKVLLFSIFLTPLTGLLVYKLSAPAHVLSIQRYRCVRCGVDFTEPIGDCPYCKKEGRHTSLHAIQVVCI